MPIDLCIGGRIFVYEYFSSISRCTVHANRYHTTLKFQVRSNLYENFEASYGSQDDSLALNYNDSLVII